MEHHGKKRIIICCDGTWMDSDGGVQTPSNVTRLARAIKATGIEKETNHPIPQVVFYQNGLGTGSQSLWVKYVGGTTGEGLAEHIKEAYSFICLNYVEGDEIFIVGFSRGAFTARSIASLINAIGLLTRKGLASFIEIFLDWEFQLKEGWKTKFPLDPFPGHKPPVTAPDYRRKLLDLELTRPDIPIKAVAVWDTVGSLGIPLIGLLPQPPSKDFSFVDTIVADNVEYAYQALALDERRRSFSPTIWEQPSGQKLPKVLKQCWFPGVHSDVGGSYPDTDLANITLCWMIDQLDPILDFDHDYVWAQVGHSNEKNEKLKHEHRAWGLGKIHNSMTFFFRIGGQITRKPGQYRETDSTAQHGVLWWMVRKVFYNIGRFFGLYRQKHLPLLTGTNETIHSSVRIRMGKGGRGYNDRDFYASSALQGWTMHGVETDPDTPIAREEPGEPGKMKSVMWKKKIPAANQSSYSNKNGSIGSSSEANDGMIEIVLPEAKLGPFECETLKLWPEINKEFSSIRPGDHNQSVGRAETFPADHSHVKLNGVDDLLERNASSSKGGKTVVAEREKKSSSRGGRNDEGITPDSGRK